MSAYVPSKKKSKTNKITQRANEYKRPPSGTFWDWSAQTPATAPKADKQVKPRG